MKPIAVDSTSLETIAYDPDREILEIGFRDQKVYQYVRVPPRVHEDLLSAPSKGSYFNRQIRGHYLYHQKGRSLS
jgi:hypothetical protein